MKNFTKTILKDILDFVRWIVIACVTGIVVGAVWTRIMNDYGHVDDETPSFAIALYKDYRGKGIGTTMMLEMLELLR